MRVSWIAFERFYEDAERYCREALAGIEVLVRFEPDTSEGVMITRWADNAEPPEDAPVFIDESENAERSQRRFYERPLPDDDRGFRGRRGHVR